MSTNDSKNAGRSGREDVAPAKGKLGIMIPGRGAVATTFVAGVEAVRNGISSPIGSMTQMGTIRLGRRSPMTSPELSPEHDLFIQSIKLKNTLRHLMGEEVITHLGLDYYDSYQSQEHDYARI